MNNQEDFQTKRKQPANLDHYRPPKKRIQENLFHNNASNNLDEQEDNDFLTLSLSLRPPSPKKPPPSPPPLPPRPQLLNPRFLQPQGTLTLDNSILPPPLQLSSSHPIFDNPLASPPSASFSPLHAPPPIQPGPSRPPRARRNPAQTFRDGKSETIPAPFPWATTRRATVLTLDAILEKGIVTIIGDVQCRKCEKQYELGFGLKEKFAEIGKFIAENKSSMHDRAPSVWMNPVLPKCKFCENESSVKPIVAEKKKEINWLFLLLGQMLGCCTLEQLKYFCKHTKNHRTGAKDRVLFLTYLGLCKQLQPDGPFDLRG